MSSLLRLRISGYLYISRSVATATSLGKKGPVSYNYGIPRGPLLYKTIPQIINEAAEKWPERQFIISVHQELKKNFQQVNEDANRLASALLSIGVKKGDRVGIWSPNCYEWAVTQFGTAKIGAILVNVNPGYRENELIYCANLVGLSTLISFQQLKSSNYVKLLESASPCIFESSKSGIGVKSKVMSSLKNVIFIEDSSNEIAPKTIARFWDLVNGNDKEEPKINWNIDPEDIWNVQFTSGTTGHPKGASLTHHGTINNAYFSSKDILEEIILCVPNPLYHCFGSINGSLGGAIYGNTIVLPAPVATASATLSALQDLKCFAVFGTPTMFVDLLRERKSNQLTSGKSHDLSSVNYIYMSGSPCPEKITREMKKSLFPNLKRVIIPYGTTEVSPVITIPRVNVSDDYEHTTVGLPLDHSEVKIVDPQTGVTLPLGETGELWTRSIYVFPGYWNQPEKTAETIDNRGWYKTG